MDATVIICTRDRRESLLRAIESLATQVLEGSGGASRPPEWELLVVDNGSQDGSGEAVKARATDFPVSLRVVREERAGVALARNRGIQCALGSVLIFVDDDVTCAPGWLGAHLDAFRDAKVAGAGGRITPQLPPETQPWMADYLCSHNGGPTARYEYGDAPRWIEYREEIAKPYGANMAVRADWAQRLDGFRSDLGWGTAGMIPGEDSDFFRQIQLRGGRLRYLPDAAVVHHIQPARTTLSHLLSWYRRKGRAQVVAVPPGSVVERLRRLRREFRHFVRHASAAARRPRRSPQRIEELALREKALGRVVGLLGRTSRGHLINTDRARGGDSDRCRGAKPQA